MMKKTTKQIALKALKEADQFVVLTLKDGRLLSKGSYSDIYTFLAAVVVEEKRLLNIISEMEVENK